MLFRRSATGCRPKTTVYSPDGTRSPPIAAIAFAAASTPASSVKPSRRVPVDPPEPLAPSASTIAVTNAVISVDSYVWTRGTWVGAIPTRHLTMGAPRPRHAEVARLAAEADQRARGPDEGHPDAEATRRGGLRLLDAVGGDVGGVVEPREERRVGGREDLGLEDTGLGPDELERLLRRPGQVRRARYRPPASLARLRIVGPPLPSFMICMGCPLPQFGIG